MPLELITCFETAEVSNVKAFWLAWHWHVHIWQHAGTYTKILAIMAKASRGPKGFHIYIRAIEIYMQAQHQWQMPD